MGFAVLEFMDSLSSHAQCSKKRIDAVDIYNLISLAS